MREIQFVDIEKERGGLVLFIWLIGLLFFTFMPLALFQPDNNGLIILIVLVIPIVWTVILFQLVSFFQGKIPKEGLLTINKAEDGTHTVQLKSPSKTLEFQGEISYELWIKKGLVSTGKQSSIKHIPQLSIVLEEQQQHFLLAADTEEEDVSKWGPIREASPYLITGEYKLEREVLEALIQILKDDGIMPTAPTFKRES
ncbi:MAG: hypothetical protein MK212_15450 [Saprospiraceae bacterium]|nr:hypothetical protein [Saprospiraceae bacterium]